MSKAIEQSILDFFRGLPAYTTDMEETVRAIIENFNPPVLKKKGAIITELAPPNKDFWFLCDGFLKEIYKNPFQNEDALFNFIPPSSVFVNEDSLFYNKRPQHYYKAYTDVVIASLSHEKFQELKNTYPAIIKLYLSGTAEIQKNRRSRLIMLRMSNTQDRIDWVREQRGDLYKIMDRVTLAQYIGVSRASLYRAFDKTGKSQF
jgi:CRP/FNR family transcriptional regulator, anaerobic regulatory protein